jgi:ABC-type transport system involved in multi-copper enzyme maturation permease subunit
MFGNLVKSQLLENLYGVKFIITFIVCFILVIAGTLSGISKYEAQIQDQTDIISINEKALKEEGNWWGVAREGQKVVKPATPLTIFASGLEESVGRTSTVREGDFPQMEDSIYSTAPIFAVFGDLDLTFIIKLVISLFAILFTYDLISGEKERGTLKLCLANSVPRNTFILGKSLGSFISMLIPLVIPMAFAMLIMLLMGNVSFTGDHWARILWIVIGYTLYMLAFFSIGLFVSTVTKSSSVSFLILLFFWVLIVLIVPKGAMFVADLTYPIPSINETRSEQQKLRDDFNREVWQAASEEFNKQNAGGERNWSLMRSIRNQVRDELEPNYIKENAKLIEGFQLKQHNLTQLAINLSRISPASAVTYIGMNMAGTGYADQENFLDQLTRHRVSFTNYIEEMQAAEAAAAGPGGGRHGPMPSDTGALDITKMPKLDYKRMSVSKSVELILPDILTLALISILFYLLAFVMFLRYDVR